MRSYKGPEHFFSKMKKKAAVQAVIDNIDDYTVEDLENLTGNQFPKWIRKVLVKYKKRDGRTPEEVAQAIANEMMAASLDKE